MPELPCIQAAVLLKNLSKQNPQHYQWQIIPATFEFLPDSNQQVTTDTSANPVIAFLEARDYVIRLVAKNSFGSDTLVRTISVGNIFTDFTQFPTDSPLCGKAVKNLLVEASGSYTFDFSFDSVRYSFSQQGNRLNLTLKDTVINDSTFSDIIRVTARHGLCRYTAERSLTVQNIPYDRIRNELALHPGLNGPFDNTCASYEAGEPHPNDGGCTVPNNWCYNDVNPDTVVFRSLWFTFIGPASGQVNIHTRGLDTRVALYEANTHEDLIRDNYRLLAAVDNTLSGNEAVLSDIAVIPGKRYWLQVDANAYAVGTFTINLFSLTIELSPNPVHQWVKIILPVAASATGTLSIVSANGKVHLQKNLNFSPENNLIEFNCADLPPGLYIVRYNSNLGSFAAKLMVVHP